MVSKKKIIEGNSDKVNGGKWKVGVVKPQMKRKGEVVDVCGDNVCSPNIISREKKLKIWDLYYEERHRNFTSKVKYWSDMKVPGIIMGKLTKVQVDLLKKTCFRNYVDVGEPQYFSQIIQHALIKEIHQRDHEEMWFLFGEKRVRFSLLEFCLISGLRMQGNDDISAFKGRENKFVTKFFKDEVVTRQVIKKVYQSAVFDDDEEAIRMSIIFLVFNFILATVDDNLVDKALLNFLSYGNLDTYPWGKLAFDQTKKSLSQALKGQVKNGDRGGVVYNFYKKGYCKSYKLNGMAYVFQVFLFETIPTLKDTGLCIDDKQAEVKLFRWTELGKAPFYKMLNDNVFGSGKLRIEIMIPTNEENERLEFGGIKSSNKTECGPERLEKVKNGSGIGFNLGDLKNIVDARVQPLEKKLDKVRKEMKKLRVDVRDELHAFHINIVKVLRHTLKKGLRARCNVGDLGRDGANVKVWRDDNNNDVMDGVPGDGNDDKVMEDNVKPCFAIVSQNSVKDLVVFTPNEAQLEEVIAEEQAERNRQEMAREEDLNDNANSNDENPWESDGYMRVKGKEKRKRLNREEHLDISTRNNSDSEAQQNRLISLELTAKLDKMTAQMEQIKKQQAEKIEQMQREQDEKIEQMQREQDEKIEQMQRKHVEEMKELRDMITLMSELHSLGQRRVSSVSAGCPRDRLGLLDS